LHGIIFYCNKTVCMTFRAKSAKSTVIPLLQLGGQSIKSVTQYKYLVIVFDTELSDDKGIQRQLRYQYCVANKLRATFSQCSNAFKNVLFVPFVCPCMHHKYGVISGSHACRECVWPIILGAGLCTTCHGQQVLLVIRFNATFLSLRPYCTKMCTCFLKDVEKSNNVWLHALMQSGYLYSSLFFEHCNCLFLTECSDIIVFVHLRVCHATTNSSFTWPWPVLNPASYSGVVLRKCL